MAALAAAALLMIFPERIFAADYRYYKIYYFSEADAGLSLFDSEEFGFCGAFTAEQIAEVLFTNLIDRGAVPGGTKLISADIRGQTLFLNFSKEFLGYGGSMTERAIVRELAKTAAEIPGVSRLTVLVGGASGPLAEGTLVREMELG